jgi:hypothetical protein
VHQPPGFAISGKKGKVLRLRKALYGLRQASMAWNAKLDSTLKGMGFGQSPHEAIISGGAMEITKPTENVKFGRVRAR